MKSWKLIVIPILLVILAVYTIPIVFSPLNGADAGC